MMYTKRKMKKKKKKSARSRKLKLKVNIKNDMETNKIEASELQENLDNIILGIEKQAGFTKKKVAEVVRRLVTDNTQAEAVVAELETAFDNRDAKFLTAVKEEAAEVDTPSGDADALTKDLFLE